jgi:hypothetical protein
LLYKKNSGVLYPPIVREIVRNLQQTGAAFSKSYSLLHNLNRYQDPYYCITRNTRITRFMQGPGQDYFTLEYKVSILTVIGLRYQRTCIKVVDPSIPCTVIRLNKC